jgi:hypothetical protein
MEGGEMHMGFMWGSLNESDHLEEQSAERTMLKLVLKKTSWKGIGLAHDRGTEAGSRELHNEV